MFVYLYKIKLLFNCLQAFEINANSGDELETLFNHLKNFVKFTKIDFLCVGVFNLEIVRLLATFLDGITVPRIKFSTRTYENIDL